MFRILKYIILFVLGYRLIKMIFGNQTNIDPSKTQTRVKSDENKAPEKETIAPKEKEGEYIDYEEIK